MSGSDWPASFNDVGVHLQKSGELDIVSVCRRPMDDRAHDLNVDTIPPGDMISSFTGSCEVVNIFDCFQVVEDLFEQFCGKGSQDSHDARSGLSNSANPLAPLRCRKIV